MKLSHPKKNRAKWDQRFYSLCITISQMSSCLSRQIGAIIIRDNTVVSTGYNGPPRGIAHCGEDRFNEDYILAKEFQAKDVLMSSAVKSICPRSLLGYVSGEGLHLCIASHAEENAIVNAARLGVSTLYTTIYMNCQLPCMNCIKKIINSGIREIVCTSLKPYDKMSEVLLEQTSIKIRTFILGKRKDI